MQKAEVIQNHENEQARNTGQEARLDGGEAYDQVTNLTL
jgi:hypothetical protein